MSKENKIPEVDTGTKPAFALWKKVVVVFLLGCMIGAFIQRNPGYLTDPETNESEFFWQRNDGLGVDAYYHIKVAYLMRTGEVQEAGTDFHWTRESMWNGNYSDKEWLYHVYLIPFTLIAEDGRHYSALVSAAKLATIIAVGLLGLAFFFSFRVIGLKHPGIWMLFMMAMLGSIFPTRLNEPRSWLFGVSFAMLGWAFTVERKHRWLFVLAIFYTLSYTASHLLLAMIGFRGLLHLVLGPDDGTRKQAFKADFKCFAFAAAGLLVGWALHPGSFALLKIWFVQNALVLHVFGGGEIDGWHRIVGGWLMGWGSDPTFPVMHQNIFGQELRPPLGSYVPKSEPMLFYAPMAIPVLAAVCSYRPSRKALHFMALSILFLVMFMSNARLAEYAVPFGIMAAAYWLQEIFRTERFSTWWSGLKFSQAKRFVAILVLLSFAGMYTIFMTGENIGPRPTYRYPTLITWFDEHPEVKGKVMYNLNWSDFPELFFFESEMDYTWGLDPMFTAAQGTERSSRVVDFFYANGKEWGGTPYSTVKLMKEEYEVDYIFADHRSNSRHGKILDEWVELGLLTIEGIDLKFGYAIYRIVDELPEKPEIEKADSATTE